MIEIMGTFCPVVSIQSPSAETLVVVQESNSVGINLSYILYLFDTAPFT